ncbi:MAG TPA: 2-dehydropantoate 2-reductase [Pseudonocardiaceae bacterium]
MRICVVGAGAIGGFIGARLAATGQATSTVARGATLAALTKHGWRLESDSGDLTAPVHASDDPAELGVQDVVIIAVKAPAMQSVASVVGPLLGPETTVLTAMNGVPWWFFDGFGGPCAGRQLDSVDPGGTIAAAIPLAHVVGGVAHMSCSRPEPGLVRNHRGARLIIGEPDHTGSTRVDTLAGVLRAGGFDVTTSTGIHTDIWYKLWGNLTINPISALTGATTDRILADDLVVGFSELVMLEAQRIGAAIGCPITETPADRNDVARKLGVFRPSMLQDVDAGRTLELDALVGVVREIGSIVGEPTPAVDALYGLTRLFARAHGLG